MFTLAACKQSTIPEINLIDCCLSSSDQHFSYIYDKSISEFSPSKEYVKCNIQGTSQRSWSFHLCKCESECYNNDPRSLQLHFHYWFSYLLTLPPLCGSLPRKSLISRMDWVSCTGDINLPHDLPPTKKSTIKSWPKFCDQYFWKFPIWNSLADEKCREIRMVKVFKWYPVIDLFDTFTGKLGHGD